MIRVSETWLWHLLHEVGGTVPSMIIGVLTISIRLNECSLCLILIIHRRLIIHWVLQHPALMLTLIHLKVSTSMLSNILEVEALVELMLLLQMHVSTIMLHLAVARLAHAFRRLVDALVACVHVSISSIEWCCMIFFLMLAHFAYWVVLRMVILTFTLSSAILLFTGHCARIFVEIVFWGCELLCATLLCFLRNEWLRCWLHAWRRQYLVAARWDLLVWISSWIIHWCIICLLWTPSQSLWVPQYFLFLGLLCKLLIRRLLLFQMSDILCSHLWFWAPKALEVLQFIFFLSKPLCFPLV